MAVCPAQELSLLPAGSVRPGILDLLYVTLAPDDELLIGNEVH